MIEPTQNPSEQASVVIVGAGLSGVVAARELEAAGQKEVVVLEAQDRVGGRMKQFERPNGGLLMEGAEMTGEYAVELLKLAEELGVETEPYPTGGKLIRDFGGQRILEEFPLETDPEAAAAFAAAVDTMHSLAEEVPEADPGAAPKAAEWDRITVSEWADQNLPSAAARQVFEAQFILDHRSTSLLFFLWRIVKRGKLEALSGFDRRFVGGSAQIPRKIAEQLDAPVHLSVPVRKIEQDADGVTLFYDGGAIRGDAAILAIEPGQVARIEFEPRLPAGRALLQNRWVSMHDRKFFAIYDRPFWREAGLSGQLMASSAAIRGALEVLDWSPSSGEEGHLAGIRVLSPSLWLDETDNDWAELIDDPDKEREMNLEVLASYFGEEAREPKEFYAFDWGGDRWSEGCGASYTVVGTLSAVGHTLRPPVGRLIWAGADVFDQTMEGAVKSGHAAAKTAATMTLQARPVA